MWREIERYVVFSSQEWKKKKGKSILGALRASNWLFVVVVVLMTMAILKLFEDDEGERVKMSFSKRKKRKKKLMAFS